MHAKYEVSISYGSIVIAKVKVDNRQTDKQTDREDKNNMPPIIRSGGIKINGINGVLFFLTLMVINFDIYCELKILTYIVNSNFHIYCVLFKVN